MAHQRKLPTREPPSGSGSVLVVEHSAGAEAADAAKLLSRGCRYYNGLPCRRCSGTLRYILTRGCVRCVRASSVAKSASRKAAKHARAMAACRRLGIT